MSDSYYNGKPVEESRQQYATERVQEYHYTAYINNQLPSFEDLRQSFVRYGEFYDQGYRLSDGRVAA